MQRVCVRELNMNQNTKEDDRQIKRYVAPAMIAKRNSQGVVQTQEEPFINSATHEKVAKTSCCTHT